MKNKSGAPAHTHLARMLWSINQTRQHSDPHDPDADLADLEDQFWSTVSTETLGAEPIPASRGRLKARRRAA